MSESNFKTRSRAAACIRKWGMK
ncbi:MULTISPECIES: hypothetical protein [Robinsoniella]